MNHAPVFLGGASTAHLLLEAWGAAEFQLTANYPPWPDSAGAKA
jgi:hypothetical protein